MGMAPPQGPLWDAIVREGGGVEAVWPADDEDAVNGLAKQWEQVADQAGEGGFQAAHAASGIDQAWRDGAGRAAVEKVNSYHEAVKALALQISQLNVMGLSYAQHLVSAKNQVNAVVASYQDMYAKAGMIAPGSIGGGDAPGAPVSAAGAQAQVAMIAAQKCMKVIDEEAKAVKNTLAAQDAAAKKARDGAIRSLPGLAQMLPNMVRDKLLKGLAAADPEGAATAAKAFKWAGRGLGVAMLPTSIALDVKSGKPVGQAVVANTAGLLASVGAGAAVGTVIGGPVGTIVGAGVGLVAGAFTSGAVNSLFEHGATHIGTALEDGATSVGDTFGGFGGSGTGERNVAH
ncbi:hypothetical protein [Fodinicola acaciae]|uniref:WXG100-like domain-containing protein n=1 Tax=Fodinicola acaciae TaxID=2681555 RepID=UPI0013D7D824|nr:hypothetical protein [Fodinicola acaciae]